MPSSKPPRAMILAAGFGTRLGALTKVRPKPMLPICGAPLVRWAVLWLRHHGVREIVINLHHLGEQIPAELGDGSALGVELAYSHEEGLILGTGGGLRKARSLLDDGEDRPIVVVNGKILTDIDLGAVLETHRASGREATMVLRNDGEGVWGGSLAADADGSLATFLGHTRANAQPGAPMMFTGVHVMQPRFLDRVPAQGEQCIVRTAYKQLFFEHEAGQGAGVGVHEHAGYWWEHSTVERYLAGIQKVLRGEVELPWAELPVRGVDPSATIGAGAEIDETAFVGPNARVGAGAKIGAFSQIGAGAVVEAGVTVEGAVVWPGATATTDLRAEVCTG
ncbi:nucleotidyltransferase family protein [Plesiocystis pacifica]|nr:NDP-sugar synthase [Plesiocystis pacifica]